MIRFIRKGGRVIPIHVSEPVKDVAAALAAGTAVITGAAITRQKAMEAIRGRGKKGTGSHLGNFLLDSALATAATIPIIKRFPRVGKGAELLGLGTRRFKLR